MNMNFDPQLQKADEEAIARMVGEGSPVFMGQVVTGQTASVETTTPQITEAVVDSIDMELARFADEGNPNLL